MFIEETTASYRLFFALWPDEAALERIVEVRGRLSREVQGRWIRPENLHVTLAFLGAVEVDRLPIVRQVAAATFGEPLELTLDRLDWWRQAQVLCLTAGRTPEGLRRLVTSLSQGLAQEGFVLDKRPFRVHMTLARKVRQRPQLANLEQSIVLKITEFSLVRSCSAAAGSSYTKLNVWPLREADPAT